MPAGTAVDDVSTTAALRGAKQVPMFLTPGGTYTCDGTAFTGLKAPQFSCLVEAPDRLLVVYRSHRVGLAPFVMGLLEALGPVFKVTPRVEHVRSKPPGEPGAEDHFVVTLAAA